MAKLDPWYEARALMRQALEDDLMGSGKDSEIDEAPLDRFIVGVLHPQNAGDLSAEEDKPESAGSVAVDAVFDPAVALSRVQYPSSLGLTFAVVPSETSVIHVSIEASRYVQLNTAENGDRTDDQENTIHRDRGRASRPQRWRREAQVIAPVDLDMRVPRIHRKPLCDGLSLHVVVRRAVDGIASVTVVLLNDQTLARGPKDGLCWFQPRIRIDAGDGTFVDRPSVRPSGVDDDDLDSYALLFRRVRNVAVGHGCAVSWHDSESVRELETTFIPRHDVPLSEPRGGDPEGFDMSRLSSTDDLSSLSDLVDRYRVWIAHREAELDGLSGQLRATARRHVVQAERAAERIESGIALLSSDKTARQAFRLMNSAMFQQRARQEHVRSGARGELVAPRGQSWRPFQIAFILLNLPGLTDAASDEREVADLLWFPTGGGKTEAYLGLIAYAILLRRLRDPKDGGVSVLMRYTLRLLTVQQFERAAALICALELERRSRLPDAAPISLGLWVGQGATPNLVSDAQKALRRLRRGEEGDEGNPMQLLRCPWCGVPLTPDEYLVDKAASKMTVRCADANCDFADALPVHLVDQDVYRERPSLVIGTVDKFAMMAWRAEVRSLFSTDGLNSPPDLIVQDELHLISGPLGTMVGLYETAVDAACARTARPKIVASTATIRRAGKQVKAVFDRTAEQFPPSGLEARDSFFSVEASSADKGTRQFVGVLAPGVSQATLLVRAYAALLQAAQDLPVDDEVKDAYWTLLGYFNSLRVLGGAFMQVVDDVPDRLKVIAERAGNPARVIDEPREMTSRKRSIEIPQELAILSTSMPSPESPAVVLATNMISVGVDVDRLGLMVVMGQPQTTAEYIQATSRVGRQHPGLVVVLYNAARSRDLSHYESFASYHRSLYRQVEATGATPFAARARDRGLHGVLVSLVRLLVDVAAPDQVAGDIAKWESEVRRLGALVVARARRVAPDEATSVQAQVDALVESWLDAASGRRLKYAGWFDSRDALLAQAGVMVADEEVTFPVDEAPWPTLTSLRDVDAESWLYLVPAGRRRSPHGS